MRYITCYILGLLVIIYTTSCNGEMTKQNEQLKLENRKLSSKIYSLQKDVDSILETPAIQFQNILDNEEIKLSDSSSIDLYLKFNQKYPNSIWNKQALYQINRIENFKKDSVIKTVEMQIYGVYKWKSSFNAWFFGDRTPKNTGIQKKIILKPEKVALFYENDTLKNKSEFKVNSIIDFKNEIVVYLNFANKKGIIGELEPPYNLLSLIPACEDCTYEDYKKVN